MNKIKYNYEVLTPFKICVLENFPFLEADFDALTNYEIMCKLAEYINKVAKNQNLVQQNVIELNNWFNNLDVQNEINNKLDEMAQKGELTDIIAQYLNLAGVLAFDTLMDLKSAENLSNGSITRTLGRDTLNDGLGYYYKIRTLTSSDVIDNDNIISLSNYNTLIGEKIISYAEKMKQDIMVVFGDSWSMPDYPYVDDQNVMWHHVIAQQKNLILKNYAVSGSGYSVTNNSFNSQVENAKSDLSLDKNKVKYVFIFGGINDLNFGDTVETSYGDDISNCINNIKNYFNKSQIIMIGCNTQNFIRRGDNHPSISNIDVTSVQRNVATSFGITFIDSLLFLYGNPSYIDQANLHPTHAGEVRLASCILSSLNGNNLLSLQDLYQVDNLDNSYINVTQIDITSTIKGNLLYLTVNFKMDTDFANPTPLSFPLKPFTTLPVVNAPLVNFNDGKYAGICRLNDSNNNLIIICEDVKADNNYVANFTISL